MLRSVQGPQARAPYLRTSGFNVKAKQAQVYRSRRGASGLLGMFRPRATLPDEAALTIAAGSSGTSPAASGYCCAVTIGRSPSSPLWLSHCRPRPRRRDACAVGLEVQT
jgi:hypothetical protein